MTGWGNLVVKEAVGSVQLDTWVKVIEEPQATRVGE